MAGNYSKLRHYLELVLLIAWIKLCFKTLTTVSQRVKFNDFTLKMNKITLYVSTNREIHNEKSSFITEKKSLLSSRL